eukprot:CAMPEP_0182417620 /NCGR_PEP_ID=MMETSP1167-20130531/2079_1 /TAXON_ID=2988 /ORGANISM="Mallomonas Sp, Strain CCMP3275" /LENGTH=229 /DNA_ID=CAMNT_0024591311 /DNA_START=96 /DNA_END=782 /DNA_ORIENTATION=+
MWSSANSGPVQNLLNCSAFENRPRIVKMLNGPEVLIPEESYCKDVVKNSPSSTMFNSPAPSLSSLSRLSSQSSEMSLLYLVGVENIDKDVTARLDSPVSVSDFYSANQIRYEAPARLQNYSGEVNLRQRSFSNIGVDEVFCRLDTTLPHVLSADLPERVQKADSGLKSGIEPHLIGDCMGGTYFLRGSDKTVSVVWKPSDEEPCAPGNPHQDQDFLGKHRQAYKGAIVP